MSEAITTQDTGKKIAAPAAQNGGFRPANIGGVGHSLVSVQPPKREDLQPAYAQILGAEEDEGTHGWYGGMSKSL